jgi:tRNA(Ile)-lysidine synthase
MRRFNPFKLLPVRSAFGPTLEPVAEEEFAALMEAVGVCAGRVAVAVSGGPDSMALALCVKQMSEVRCRMSDDPSPAKSKDLLRKSKILRPLPQGERDSPVAFIVDHGLREESSAEAAEVQRRLAAIGVESEILTWGHGAVTSRVHVQARKARYDLLIEACKRRGIRDLLLAHQREDQAETILMRFAKGSGLDGLAGMAPVKVVDGVRLLRPFLGVSKARLVATCEAAKIPYLIDPSNVKEKYARGRLRRVQQALADEGFTVDRLVDLGERAREAREALDYATRALLRVMARMDIGGVVHLNLEQLRSAPQAVALRALGACLRSVHPADYGPERSLLLPLLRALCGDDPMGARTLGGCVVHRGSRLEARGSGEATIIREYAAIADVQEIAPGETVIWDGRWRVSYQRSDVRSQMSEGKLTVRALGEQTHETVDRLALGLRRLVPQGRTRAALPALWEGDRVVSIFRLEGMEGGDAYACVLNRLLE